MMRRVISIIRKNLFRTNKVECACVGETTGVIFLKLTNDGKF